MNQLNATREFETKEQRRLRIKAVFDSFDINKDGTIDFEEFTDGIGSLFDIQNLESAEVYKKFFKTIFNMCDKSGWFKRKDQKLDLGEFTKIADAIPIYMTKDIKTNLARMMFNFIDDDESGKITKKEVAEFLKYSDFSKVTINEFIADLDKNGDGEIDFVEFFLWFKKLAD